jgi:single-strand DNA-binding protein
MSSVNKAIILGNVGQDPEVRQTKNGTAVCNFSIATNKTWKTQDGQKQDKTSWHRVTAWGKVAEIAGQYVKKGSKVYVEGELEYGSFTNKDGVEVPTCEIVIQSLQLLSRPEGNATPKAKPSDDDFSDEVPF